MTDEYSLRHMILRTFLKDNSLGPSEMAKKLDANYNSVKAAFAKLTEDKLLQRSGRGNYEPNYSGIILYLMDRIENLEKQVK
jgi:Mn-dependent DtxR family transcriptional regulator